MDKKKYVRAWDWSLRFLGGKFKLKIDLFIHLFIEHRLTEITNFQTKFIRQGDHDSVAIYSGSYGTDKIGL